MLVDAEHADAVEAVRVLDQDACALGQDGIVGGVPRNPEPLSDPRDRQVGDDDALQRPRQPSPGELRAWLHWAAKGDVSLPLLSRSDLYRDFFDRRPATLGK